MTTLKGHSLLYYHAFLSDSSEYVVAKLSSSLVEIEQWE